MATLVENKKARMRFRILETYSAGLELEGGEVKSLRAKHGSLDGARIVVRGGEAYMTGASIPPYQPENAPKKSYDPERTRRLLLKKDEIQALADAEAKKGLTIVPIEVYNSSTYLKVRVAVVAGKGKHDRREDIKKRESDIEARRVLKRK